MGKKKWNPEEQTKAEEPKPSPPPDPNVADQKDNLRTTKKR